MIKDPSRRNFLRTAPAATVAGLSLSEALLHRSMAAQTAAPEPFQLFTAQTIAGMVQGLEANPGEKALVKSAVLPFSITVTCEENKIGKEFEWHEGRDHVFQILEGTTIYEVGGKPQNARNTKPGEWLAPVSEGATSFTLHKGDMLVIPRGTPHKRRTTGKVTLTLIATETPHP